MQKSKFAVAMFSTLFGLGSAAAEPLAFPEALGFGAQVTGGRAGSVYHVTNLNDSGEGSFRDAVSQGNRIVVFDVGGIIHIQTAVSIKSNITIAGQTAPGEGIAIHGGKLSTGKQSNIIIRYLRIRPGENTNSEKDDALNLYDAKNVIVDHCSVELAPWNNFGGSSDDANYRVTGVTVQNSLIANPIGQQFGAHIESVDGAWSWYYNAFVNTHNRNPLDKINDVFVNNILYNFEAGYTTHTSTHFNHDIVNNYFVYGPKGSNPWFQVDKNQSIYASGNMIDTNRDGVLNGEPSTIYYYQGAGEELSSPWNEMTVNGPMLSAASALRYVTSQSGVLPYDDIDSLVWYQVGTLGIAGALVKSVGAMGLTTNNGWGEVISGEKALDTDGDGIPDFFETAMGYNVTSDDAMTIGADGYAYIEKYINWLGAMHMTASKNGKASFDLRSITKGFQAVSPSYTLSAAENGSVSLDTDGYTATFSPNPNFTGLASFKYTVKGSDGTKYTGRVEVLVEESDIVSVPALVLNAGYPDQSLVLGDSIQSITYKFFACGGAKATELPDGITAKVNTSDSTIVLQGIPTATGIFGYTIVTTDDGGESATVSGTITVRAMASVITASTEFLSSVNAAYPNEGVGAYEENNAGWIDSGYYNFNNSLESYGAWNLNVPTAKNSAILNIRFANGGSTDRSMELFLNGKSAGIIVFPSTSNWTTYDSVSVQVNLSKDTNVLRLKSLTENGGPNIDEFRFDVAGVTQIPGELLKETEQQINDPEEEMAIGSTVPLQMVTSAAYDLRTGILRMSHSAYVQVSVFDMSGRKVANFAGNVSPGATQLGFSRSTLPKGRYQVCVQVK